MKVAFIGGLDRLEHEWTTEARAKGISLEFHTGRVGGRGGHELEALVRRADHVVVVTSINSHGAVALAKRFGKRHEKPVHILNHCGRTAALELLDTFVDARAGVRTAARSGTGTPSVTPYVRPHERPRHGGHARGIRVALVP